MAQGCFEVLQKIRSIKTEPSFIFRDVLKQGVSMKILSNIISFILLTIRKVLIVIVAIPIMIWIYARGGKKKGE